MSAAELQEPDKRTRAPVVLVVEDDLAYRRSVRDMLMHAGYVVLEAGDGTHALRMLLADEMPQPTVILLDLWLPVMSGHEFLKVLTAYHWLCRIPVILMSAGPPYRSDVSTEAAWIAKPFSEELLLSLIGECCAAEEERLDD